MVLYSDRMSSTFDPAKPDNLPRAVKTYQRTLVGLPVAWCHRAPPLVVAQEALSCSLHVKFVGNLRVCGSATVLLGKVVPNSTSLGITAKSTHEENATAGPGAFSICSTFFPHCIALASMQLLMCSTTRSGIILTFVLCGLLPPGRISSGPMYSRTREKSHRRRIKQQ